MSTLSYISYKGNYINEETWKRIATYCHFHKEEKLSVIYLSEKKEIFSHIGNIPIEEIFDVCGSWGVDIINYNILDVINDNADNFMNGDGVLNLYKQDNLGTSSDLQIKFNIINGYDISNSNFLQKNPNDTMVENHVVSFGQLRGEIKTINLLSSHERKKSPWNSDIEKILIEGYSNKVLTRFKEFSKVKDGYKLKLRQHKFEKEMKLNLVKVKEPSYDL